MFSDPQPSLLEGLCLREVLAPNVCPGDTTHEADSSWPRCPEAETQEGFAQEVEGRFRATSGFRGCDAASHHHVLLPSPSVPAASLATVVSLACLCSTRVTAMLYPIPAGPGGFCAAQPSLSSPDSSGPRSELWL